MVRCGGEQVGLGRVRRAFTLIELLVVIAVVALLIALLLPALGHAKRAAQSSVSLSNLRQCGAMQATYAADNHDAFENPFDKDNPRTWSLQWYQIVAQSSLNGGPLLGYDYGDPEYCTELFASGWATFMTQYLTSSSTFSQVMLSPNDTVLQLRTKQRLAQYLGVVDGHNYECSYWFPPTLWLGTAPFKTASRVTVG